MNLIDAQIKEILQVTVRLDTQGNAFAWVKVKYGDDGGEGTKSLKIDWNETVKVGDIFQH